MRSPIPAIPAVRSLALLFGPVWLAGAAASADPIAVLTVDVTPLVSPGDSRFGPQNTMGMALQAVDTGGLFAVTEVTPAAFRAMTVQELAAFDLIAVNNHPRRLGAGLGTTWHQAVGIEAGGRVLLNSHDAPRFHMKAPAGSLEWDQPGPGVEPFGAPELVRQAALWAGGVPGRTGLLIFNDASFFAFAGGVGWSNPHLMLPREWGITDYDPFDRAPLNGDGYTDIVDAFENHPIYQGLTDLRFGIKSISSFGGNATAASFHSVLGTYERGIFTPVEVIVNSGDPNPGDFPVMDFRAPNPGSDGRAIALIREAGDTPQTECADGADNDGDGDVDFPSDAGCTSAYDVSEGPDCRDGVDNDGDGLLDYPDDPRCDGPDDVSERSDCADGIDNDGDGEVDWPADLGCRGPFAESELPECSDGIDNDNDFQIDYGADIGCASPEFGREAPECSDGMDNDDDGQLDSDGGAWLYTQAIQPPDARCGGDPTRLERNVGRCGLGAELALVVLGLTLAAAWRWRRQPPPSPTRPGHR